MGSSAAKKNVRQPATRRIADYLPKPLAEKWNSRAYGKGSLTLVGDTFIVYSDSGRVASVKPSVERCEEISGYQVLQGKATWAVPVLAQGRLYCRSLAELTCLDVSP